MKGTWTGAATSAASAVLVLLSSACCVGPLAVALSLAGLGSTTLLAAENLFGPYRPYILSATALSLALGFYSAYRPRDRCQPGQWCGRPGILRLQRISLWLAALLMLTLAYFTYLHPNLDVYFGIYL